MVLLRSRYFLTSKALGGKAYHAPKIEVGFPEITLTKDGQSDPVLSHFKVFIIDPNNNT
jgi:hypothetical protein